MMKKILNILCATLALTAAAAPLAAAPPTQKNSQQQAPAIKVLIAHDRPGVLLEVKGKYKLFDPNTGNHISTRFNGKRKFMQGLKDGLRWGEEFPGLYQIMIVPDETVTTTVVDGVEYHGIIYVYDIGGTVSVVNQVNLEDYLSSTLAQRYKQLPDEALNAVVIAARTAAFYRLDKPKSQYFNVDGSDTGYQGYAAIVQGSPIEKAIKATRYMVMSAPSTNPEKIVTFDAQWPASNSSQPVLAEAVPAKISLADVTSFAEKGDHAAQILGRAFPGIKIELVYQE